VALETSIPVIDPYGSVFRLLRTLGLPFGMWRVDDAAEAANAPFAILGVYGKLDPAAIAAVARRVPTVLYSVMARPSYNDAIALGAIDVVSDRMEPTAARAVILQAFRER
jgi:hypothetical protein